MTDKIQYLLTARGRVYVVGNHYDGPGGNQCECTSISTALEGGVLFARIILAGPENTRIVREVFDIAEISYNGGTTK